MFARFPSPSPLRRASSRPLFSSAARYESAGSWNEAGSSSVPISKTRFIPSPTLVAGYFLVGERAVLERRKAHPRAGREIERGAVVRQLADPHDVALPLGDADGAARVEQVEGVRALQAIVVGRQRQLCLPELPALALVEREELEEQVRVCGLEAVLRLLDLVLPEAVAVGEPGAVRVPEPDEGVSCVGGREM